MVVPDLHTQDESASVNDQDNKITDTPSDQAQDDILAIDATAAAAAAAAAVADTHGDRRKRDDSFLNCTDEQSVDEHETPTKTPQLVHGRVQPRTTETPNVGTSATMETPKPNCEAAALSLSPTDGSSTQQWPSADGPIACTAFDESALSDPKSRGIPPPHRHNVDCSSHGYSVSYTRGAQGRGLPGSCYTGTDTAGRFVIINVSKEFLDEWKHQYGHPNNT